MRPSHRSICLVSGLMALVLFAAATPSKAASRAERVVSGADRAKLKKILASNGNTIKAWHRSITSLRPQMVEYKSPVGVGAHLGIPSAGINVRGVEAIDRGYRRKGLVLSADVGVGLGLGAWVVAGRSPKKWIPLLERPSTYTKCDRGEKMGPVRRKVEKIKRLFTAGVPTVEATTGTHASLLVVGHDQRIAGRFKGKPKQHAHSWRSVGLSAGFLGRLGLSLPLMSPRKQKTETLRMIERSLPAIQEAEKLVATGSLDQARRAVARVVTLEEKTYDAMHRDNLHFQLNFK